MTTVSERAHARDCAEMDRELKRHQERFPNSERVLEAIGLRTRTMPSWQMREEFEALQGQADNLLDLQEQGQDISADLAEEWLKKLEVSR